MINSPNHIFSEKALNDLKLINRAIDDDETAYTIIMTQYKESVYYMLLKMVGNKSDAEDLTMETFTKAFAKIKQYAPTHAFSTWLFKIASNTSIDFLRKRKELLMSIDKIETSDDGEGKYSFELNCPNENPEKALITKQKKEYTRLAINKLKPDFKILIEMRYFEELTYEEIASKTELPLGTVKARIFRAKEMLHKIIEGSGKD